MLDSDRIVARFAKFKARQPTLTHPLTADNGNRALAGNKTQSYSHRTKQQPRITLVKDGRRRTCAELTSLGDHDYRTAALYVSDVHVAKRTR